MYYCDLEMVIILIRTARPIVSRTPSNRVLIQRELETVGFPQDVALLQCLPYINEQNAPGDFNFIQNDT